MPIKIEMPKLSDTMNEGTITSWHIKEGDEINPGDIIAEVETDKANMDLEAFDKGTVLKILVQEGEKIPLGGIMAIIGDKNEDISSYLNENTTNNKKQSPIPLTEKKQTPSNTTKDQKHQTVTDSKIKASPLARALAKQKEVALNEVIGSGPSGRIIKKDIDLFQKNTSLKVDEKIAISSMRQTIINRLSQSKFSAPHYYETMDIDVKEFLHQRKLLNAKSEVKISINDMLIKVVAQALKQHPIINSSFTKDHIIIHKNIHIAMAVGIEDGLVTPVIQHAEQKSLTQIATETRQLITLAKDKKLQIEQLEGSTFTISNLGMYNIDSFTAIINPPNSAILAIGGVRTIPVIENDKVVPGQRMKITLSSDHRIIDGVKAAEFLNTLKLYIETPLAIML